MNKAILIKERGTGFSVPQVDGAEILNDYKNNEANAPYAIAMGLGTIASDEAQVAMGKYNVQTSDAALVIGGGTAEENRDNLMTVDWQGDMRVKKDIYAGKEKVATESYVQTQIQNNPGSGGEIIQSDWNQNDSSKADYIKNRPFYKEEVALDYIELPCGKEPGVGEYQGYILLTSNDWYTVEVIAIDGTVKNTYRLQGIHDDNLDDTYLEFAEGLIRSGSYYEWYALDISAFRIFGDDIQSTKTVYHQISQEYLDLPDMSSVFIVNASLYTDGTVDADKTYQDIFQAHSAGKIIQCRSTSGGSVGLLFACNSAQAMFLFQANNGSTLLVRCSSSNVWTIEFYDVEYAQKSYVDNAIQEAIIDSWSEVTAPDGMTINETEVSE